MKVRYVDFSVDYYFIDTELALTLQWDFKEPRNLHNVPQNMRVRFASIPVPDFLWMRYDW